MPHSFQQRGQNATKESSALSRSGEKTGLQSQFHQANKFVKHSPPNDSQRKWKTYDEQNQDITQPEAFFPMAKNPTVVCAAQLSVLELLTKPEGCIQAN